MGYAVQPSGQWLPWTPTFTGFSADPTGVVAQYCLIGKMCTIHLHMTAGTSNTTTFTMTLPVNGKTRSINAVIVTNNSTVQIGRGDVAVVSDTNIMTFFSAPVGTAFTGSGTKAAFFTITYEVT